MGHTMSDSKSDTHYYIGLISGTSVDGIDCALVGFAQDQTQLIAASSYPMPSALRDRVLQLCSGQSTTLQEIGEVHIALGREFGSAVIELLENTDLSADDIIAIGSHGQTVWHEPDGDLPFTLQLADPNTIAAITNITTVADLRGRDLVVGGQGAPLAPLLHRELFQSTEIDRAVVNIGGMSNVTFLPSQGDCLAFDTGPGNVLLDYWVNKHQQQPFDKDGEWAATGTANSDLLNALLNDEFLNRQPPKSTGREHFNGEWLEQHLSQLEKEIPTQDTQATLLEFTAQSLAEALTQYGNATEIYLCGGGAHNKQLVATLSNILSNAAIASSSELGIDPDWVEAVAFAWLAKMAMENRTLDTAPFTGANQAVKLGAIYPK